MTPAFLERARRAIHARVDESGRRLMIVVAISTMVVFAACAGDDPETATPPAQTEAATPSETVAPAKEACKPPEFAPTYLPWHESGPFPEPERYKNGKDVILVWWGPLRDGGEDLSAHVDLSTNYKDKAEDTTRTFSVRGEEGSLTWNPKFSEMGLRWTERDEPCGHYALFLSDDRRSEAWHEREFARIVDSLE